MSPVADDDYRSLCAALVSLVERCPVTSDTDWIAERNKLIVRFRAASRIALSAPQQGAPSDEEISECLIAAGVDALEGESCGTSRTYWEGWHDHTMAGIRAVLARYGAQAVPVPVAERSPGEGDRIRRNNDDWCWGQERSLLTGNAAARWRLMRVSSLEDEAVNWLPYWALPLPESQP